MAAALFMTLTVMETAAEARAGGGRSMGSRGSRSYSRPASPYTAPTRQQAAPQQNPQYPHQQQPAGGGFFRSMAGGIAGGLLGGMLFRSLGFAGGAGMAGGGIGLFDIILIGGIGYMIFRMVRRKREEAAAAYAYGQPADQFGAPSAPGYAQPVPPQTADAGAGVATIRQMDPSFDEGRFCDGAMDIFFKVQGAWMNRDLSPVATLLTAEMGSLLQGDVETLLREKRVNRLENIAVRDVEIVEAWQESGQDFITARIYANLLDYTTDEAGGQVVAGSRTEPVKFEEYWTFTRPVGNNPWRLSAIEQK
jgi:predicted lipid-binding transport protein (Tim44 family)